MNSTLQIIAVLLFLILCVMLNGAEEVKSYLASLSIWFGGFFLLYVVYKVVALLLGEMNYDAKNRSSQGEPWLYRHPLALGIGGFVLVWLAAFIVAGTVHNPGFAKAMDGLPLEMAPAWLLSISAVTFVLESLWLLIFPQRKEAHLLGQLRDGRTLTSAQTKWLAKRQNQSQSAIRSARLSCARQERTPQMKVALIAAVLLAAGPISVQAGADDSGSWRSGAWMLARCKEDSTLCTAFIGGMIEMNLLNKNAGIRSFWCLPNNATIMQVRAVIVNELSKKPETWNQNFALLATRALMDTFPCKKP